MNKTAISSIINTLLALIPDDLIKSILDKVFDAIEDKVQDSANTWDDAIVLPLITKAREILNVPDND